MSDLTQREDIQKLLKNQCIPAALKALTEILTGSDEETGKPTAKAADIKLAFTLAEQFGVDHQTETEVKPMEGLTILEDFKRENRA